MSYIKACLWPSAAFGAAPVFHEARISCPVRSTPHPFFRDDWTTDWMAACSLRAARGPPGRGHPTGDLRPRKPPPTALSWFQTNQQQKHIRSMPRQEAFSSKPNTESQDEAGNTPRRLRSGSHHRTPYVSFIPSLATVLQQQTSHPPKCRLSNANSQNPEWHPAIPNTTMTTTHPGQPRPAGRRCRT